jgi:hypothetical protein
MLDKYMIQIMHQSARVDFYVLYELLYEEIISPSKVWKYPENS